jgi:hypothetical protein
MEMIMKSADSQLKYEQTRSQWRSDKQAAKHQGFERLIPGVASMTLWLSWSEHLAE